MSVLKSKFDNFMLSVAMNMNAINASLTGKVNEVIFNNQTNQFTSQINQLTSDLNDAILELEFFKGMHFTANQASSMVYLKNINDETITEINVGFLNNEGTQFSYNSTTQNLELKNDQGELLSTIPISNFVTNLANALSFNNQTPYTLELKNSNCTVASSVNIGIQNVQNLETRLNAIKTIYNSDDTITGNRNISLSDKYVRFNTNTDTVEIKDNKITIPSIFTNKYGGTQSGQILLFTLNNNLPKIAFGNNDTDMLEVNSKNYVFKNMKTATNQTRTLTINTEGEIAWVDGITVQYIPGDGIDIIGNVISLKPSDSINLIFNW